MAETIRWRGGRRNEPSSVDQLTYTKEWILELVDYQEV